MSEDGLPPLRVVIERHQLRAKKSLGQNFLLDLNLTRRIARLAAPFEGVTIIEVGPGPGGLTRALLMEGAEKVIAIERDDRCLPALEAISDAYPDRLEVIMGDALDLDLANLASGPVKIVANLPYNIGTALFTHWMTSESWPPFWESLTLMFQREVANRIVAEPGSSAYGRLSVLSQWRAYPSLEFDVNPQAFTPPPKVTSTLVHIIPAKPQLDVPISVLELITKSAFGQRRKMLRQSLRTLNIDPKSILDMAELMETSRAEEISPMGYCRLTQAAMDLL